MKILSNVNKFTEVVQCTLKYNNLLDGTECSFISRLFHEAGYNIWIILMSKTQHVFSYISPCFRFEGALDLTQQSYTDKSVNPLLKRNTTNRKCPTKAFLEYFAGKRQVRPQTQGYSR